nr:MAG TPA: major capsid protein [Caudoviricetes sp.]
MKIEQVHTLLNSVLKETLGETAIQVEDLQNVVALGTVYEDILANDAYDKYVGKLINHIGRVVFVDRVYKGGTPDVMMDGWEFGSIKEKISCGLPESKENPTWNLKDGQTYDQNVFHAPPAVKAKFFNSMTTFQVDISITKLQVKQSFSNAVQLNAFYSMIENKIRMRLTIDYDNLTMRTINNFIGAAIYSSFKSKEENVISAGSKPRAVNLLYLYKLINPTTTVTAENCIYDKDFLRFASGHIGEVCDRLRKPSKLFNAGDEARFTPEELQKLVLLSKFERNCHSYLYGDTFHDDEVRLPKAETVTFWQGSGTDFDFGSISDVDVNIKDVFNDTPTVGGIEIHTAGVLGVLFDREALGVCNKENRVTSNYNALAEFTNYYYKSDAEYFNDYDENFVVFYVAE